MAVAYKCDRCGKLYEVNIISHENEPRFSVEESVKGNGMTSKVRFDLCGDCQIGQGLFLKRKIFTPGEVQMILCLHGQKDRQFATGEKIMYTPSEVCKILMEDDHNG